MKRKAAPVRALRAKLIFNAISGRPQQSPQQLVEILDEMQNQNITPEVFMVRPDSDVEQAVRSAIRSGIRLIAVAGGDGTIDSVAGAMIGRQATLGIIPTGTRNNLAFNLGVPEAVREAVGLLRTGRRLRIDVGSIRTKKHSRWFVEAASLGLISDLYPAADELQHGDVRKIGELLAGFVTTTPARLSAVLNRRHAIETNAFMMLIANMPYFGPRVSISPEVSCRDRLLDVFVFSEMTKLGLISYAVQSATGPVEDPHVKHYRVSELSVEARPRMPALADGVVLGKGPVRVKVHPRALSVIAGTEGPGIGDRG